MRFKSNILSQASGSIGGSTYSHNRYGMYIRNRTIPVHPNSLRQNIVKSLMADATQSWANELTPIQRAQWDTYGAAIALTNPLGDTYKNTGFNWYIGAFINRQAAGIDAVTDGPANLNRAAPDETVVGAVSGPGGSLAFNTVRSWANENGAHMIVWIGNPVSETVNFYNGPWKLIGTIDGNATTAPDSPANFVFDIGGQSYQKVYFKHRVIRADGRYSQTFISSAIIA